MFKQTTSPDQPDTIYLKKSHFKAAIPFLIIISGIIVVYMVWGIGPTEVQAAQATVTELLLTPNHSKTQSWFKMSTRPLWFLLLPNAGVMFDLELPVAWNVLTGHQTSSETLWAYILD